MVLTYKVQNISKSPQDTSSISWGYPFLVCPRDSLCCAVLSHSVVPDSLRPLQASLSTGILQARILEWVAMPSSRRSS